MDRQILKVGFMALILLGIIIFSDVAFADPGSSSFSGKEFTKNLEACPCNCPFTGTSANASCIPLCPFGQGGGINKYYTYRTTTPNFSASETIGPAPLTVKFRDLSRSTMSSWLWDFGDGTTSSEQNPIHTYEHEGTYSVTLVLGGGNTDTISGTQQITEGAWAGSTSTGTFSYSSGTQVSWTKKDFITVTGSEQPKPESINLVPENKTVSTNNSIKNSTPVLKNKTKIKK